MVLGKDVAQLDRVSVNEANRRKAHLGILNADFGQVICSYAKAKIVEDAGMKALTTSDFQNGSSPLETQAVHDSLQLFALCFVVVRPPALAVADFVGFNGAFRFNS